MRSKRFERLTRLEVRWTDIVSDPAWGNHENTKTSEIVSVGYFLNNKNKTLRIAHSVSEDGESDVTCIPWAVVVSVEEF